MPAAKEAIKLFVTRVKGPKKGEDYTRYFKTQKEKEACRNRYSEYYNKTVDATEKLDPKLDWARRMDRKDPVVQRYWE